MLPQTEIHKQIVIHAPSVYNRFMKCSRLSQPITCAHEWISRLVRPGDTVVDATAGNGHDTVFLAHLTGTTGSIHAFDIQPEAILATEERLRQENLWSDAVHLHLASHARLSELVQGAVKAVIFNLGYLPGGNKNLITQETSTLDALRQAAALIMPNGILSVMCYPGHDGGEREAQSVENFLAALPHHSWRVGKYQLLNTSSPAPVQICAFRLD